LFSLSKTICNGYVADARKDLTHIFMAKKQESARKICVEK
jgi:hypothetical protein